MVAPPRGSAAEPNTLVAEPIGDHPDAVVARAILRDCFEIFHANVNGLAKLWIETSNDLFDTTEEIYEFKSKRKEWVKKFDEALRKLFERRLSGQRRIGHRPDAEMSLSSLRVMNDLEISQQSALVDATKRLMGAAAQELKALDYRVSVLFDEPPSRQVDNPFSPTYLIDAIGLTTRSLYAEPRIWRTVMERIVSDFVPGMNSTVIQLNRFLARRGVLPDVGAMLRTRSDLRPADDGQLLPLFGRLLNEVHPSLQAWRSLDLSAATAAGYQLAPIAVNPYLAALTRPSPTATSRAGGFPEIDAMMAFRELSSVLKTLDYWQRADPMTAYLRSDAAVGIDAGVTPVNRIPWIHAAITPQVPMESGRTAIDVVGFLFDYIFRDPSIPPGFRIICDGLQVPILKVALADPSFFVNKAHPARQLINALAGMAIGADDDLPYGKSVEKLAKSIVDTIGDEYVIDIGVFERACRTLKKFTDDWQEQMSLAIRPHVDAALAAESRDADRSLVRALIRDKLAGVDIPFDVRAFIGTGWADYLTRARQTDGSRSASYTAAIQTMDDLLWSIIAKERAGHKARLSKLIPSLVCSLRAGGAAAQVTDEKMKRFLDALYELHIAALRPRGAGTDGSPTLAGPAPPSLLAGKPIANVHDFVADMVLGTWLAFDNGVSRVHARLSWRSPLNATYVFTGRAGSEIMVITPEELAWEVSAGKVALIMEPVPLFDRSMSATLEYLAEQRAKRGSGAQGEAPGRSSPPVGSSILADAQS